MEEHQIFYSSYTIQQYICIVKQAPMSRIFMKNDLFYFSGNKPNNGQNQKDKGESNRGKFYSQSGRRLPPQSAQNNHENCEKQGERQSSNEVNVVPFDAEDALKIELKQQTQKVDFDEQLKKVIQEHNANKTAQKPTNNKARKSFMFTPKSTFSVKAVVVQEKKQKDAEEIKKECQQKKKQKQQMWKLRQELKTLEQKQIKEGEPQQTNKSKEDQTDQKALTAQKSPQKQQDQQEGSKKKKKAKTTGKKKMIKKQANYVKLNLKNGGYKDRRVGGLAKNILKLQKSRKMKMGYGKQAASQLKFEGDDCYNAFSFSLSKSLVMTINIEGEGQVESEQQIEYEIPEDHSRQNLQRLMQTIFGHKTFREGQYETIKNILQGKSTLFVSETASGKSLTYQMSSIINKGLTIIISPLVSLMLDQVEHLPRCLPGACISSLLDYQQKQAIIKMVKQGRVQLLYITPQSFLTDFLYHVKQFPPINFVCIDEAHSLSQLSNSFRASYLSLQDIVLRHLKYKTQKPVVLCLTATANLQTMHSISQKMKIENIIRSTSVINKNLFVTITREQIRSKYGALMEYLKQPAIRSCRGILIYCRAKYLIQEVYYNLRNSGVMCEMYHSELPQRQKVQTLQNFRTGQNNTRIVIATIALGMGLDFQNLDCIIHINMPKSVQNFVQEIGRAGRRQKRAYCHLFLDKNDYFTERNYFIADQLDGKIFRNIVDMMRTNNAGGKVVGQDKRSKKKVKKENEEQIEQQTLSLKRMSISEGTKKPVQECDIYEEEQQDKIFEKYLLQNKQKIEEQNKLSLQRQIQKDKQNNSSFMPLFYCKADLLTDAAQMKQQAILNILLKTQKVLGKGVFKVLPLSNETLKISFFKKNQQQVKNESEMFKFLVQGSKFLKGTYYINLITKCNHLQRLPTELLTELYALSRKYFLRIETLNQVFVWQHRVSYEQTFQKLSNPEICKQIIYQFNLVQRTSLTKFNIFYSLCFNYSIKNMQSLIRNNLILPRNQQLPQNSVLNKFNQYFSKETYEYYQMIAQEQQNVPSQTKNSTVLNNIEARELPITQITQQNKRQIAEGVKGFIKHILGACVDKKFVQAIAPYRDGRIITRVFLGANSKNSSFKTYGEHSYWKKFTTKDYRQLLKQVKQKIHQFIIQQGPRLMHSYP